MVLRTATQGTDAMTVATASTGGVVWSGEEDICGRWLRVGGVRSAMDCTAC